VTGALPPRPPSTEPRVQARAEPGDDDTADATRAPNLHGARALVVDDDRAVRNVLQVNLSKAGMVVELAETATAALAALHERAFDVVITDVRMPGASGLDLLAAVRKSWPDTQVVVMTGFGSVRDAVSAIKAGATDYLIKPIAREELLVIVERALEQRTLRAELVQLRREVHARYGFERLIGTTPAMQSLYEELAAVADSDAAVLLQGPTGTGKELLAFAVHYRSPRRGAPMVRVNCAAIPESLIESELFGHERGSFTGAFRQHIGRFEAADGGTLFLDEIGELPLLMQGKLLRALESGEIQRVGGSSTLQVDVRVVAATNRDLHQEAAAGRFREDLYFRLNVVTLRVPPLRERIADVPLLVEHFVRRLAEKTGRPPPRVTRATLDLLMGYAWPGNVRQLEHTVERAMLFHRDGDVLDIPLPLEARAAPAPQAAAPLPTPALPPEGTTLNEVLEARERELIILALEEARGVQAHAAKRLGLSKSNLNYRIQKLGIQIDTVRFR
jgi:DNA-binding NtrC family response regulator